MTNFIALPQGPAMRRQGFAYVDTALNTTEVRLLPFKVPGSTDYCVELGPGYMGILTRANGREQFTSSELIRNGDFESGLLYWTFVDDDNDYFLSTAKDLKRVSFVQPVDVPLPYAGSARVKQTVITGGAGASVISFNWGGFLADGRITPGVIEDGRTITIRVGSSDGASDIYTEVYTPSTDSTGREPYAGNIGAEYQLGTGSESININLTGSDPVYIEFEINSVRFNLVGSPSGFVSDIRLSAGVTTSDTFPTPWPTEADLSLIQYVAESGGGRMYFTHPNYAPQLLELDSGSWSFGPVSITAAPVSWTGDNWPSICEFYQGRLWLGATPSDQSTIWGSVSGDPFDFTTGINDDDSLELPLSTTGGIKWLKGQKGLVVGTDIGEQVITSQGSLITPTDRKAEKQSGWGSTDIQPSLAGNDIVYISQDRTKVRAVNTFFNTASWVSVDLTWVAEHITRGRIVESIYIQNPNYQLYFMLADGTIVACTYDREHDTIGWMRLVTSGQFLSTTKTDSVEGTILWVAVRRNSQIFIEAVDPDESLWEFTDSWVNNPIVSKVVSGLDHLEGLTVQVINDGAVEPDKVVTGGQITTEQDGSFAVVGLEYEASMTTLPLSQGNKAGTALGSKRRFSRVFVQLYDSALPRINGQLPPDRTPSTPMNTVEPNLTDEVDVRNLGRDNGGRVTITQNLPKKTMVTAIYGKAGQEQT
jgi:hypothetical protein